MQPHGTDEFAFRGMAGPVRAVSDGASVKATGPQPQTPADEFPQATPDAAASLRPDRAPLLDMCREPLRPFLVEREEAVDLIDGLIARADAETAQAAGRLRHELFGLEPSVTLIGQVKAGKTSLLNAMVGAPGLLPADVNPWTSVVTSLHLGPPAARAKQAARFTFFDAGDWERLTRRGGRVGELAGRSGAEDEAERIRAQVDAMHVKTRERLGRKFELLLGTSHDYRSFDPGLIERYVCLGDDFVEGEDEDLSDEGQGRFADITKSAELWLPKEDWPMGLCLRDTPGVNDTFMMREQITIGAIRDSRLCVVVLSAHQALSSVDMALIRLISNVRAREVVIFVNRIDELADPATQIEEIRQSIRATLAGHDGLEDVPILFGSARWATLALTGALSELEDEAAEALLSHAAHVLPDIERECSPLELIWWLSGLPTLYEALWERIAEGPAREKLQDVARGAMNLAIGMSAAAEADPIRLAASHRAPIESAALLRDLEALEATVTARFDKAFEGALEAAAGRLDRSHRSFLDRATAALIQHLEAYGELEPWRYDPTGLRLLLRSGYLVFAKAVKHAGEAAAEEAAEGIAALYARMLDRPAESFHIQAASVPRLPAPVLLGQTIALDLEGTWWRRWWTRRRGYRSFAPDFRAMIEAETSPIVGDLRDSHCRPAGAAIRTELAAYFQTQRQMIARIAQTEGGNADAPLPDGEAERLSDAVHRLGRLAA